MSEFQYDRQRPLTRAEQAPLLAAAVAIGAGAFYAGRLLLQRDRMVRSPAITHRDADGSPVVLVPNPRVGRRILT